MYRNKFRANDYIFVLSVAITTILFPPPLMAQEAKGWQLGFLPANSGVPKPVPAPAKSAVLFRYLGDAKMAVHCKAEPCYRVTFSPES
jgi:hypothetical protein